MSLNFLRESVLHNGLTPSEDHRQPGLTAAIERLCRFRPHLPSSNGALDQMLSDLLQVAAQAEQTMVEQRARIRFLETLSNTDELTGLLNRRGFQVELQRALDRAKRQEESGLLVLCDLDHFKAINDSCGHPAGDAVLRGAAHVLKQNIRSTDYLGRVGGDEFAILMPGTAKASAQRLVDKLRSTVNGTGVPWQGRILPVHASFGCQGYDHSSRLEGLMFQADQALYLDKHPKLVT